MSFSSIFKAHQHIQLSQRSRNIMECSVCATHHGSHEKTCSYCGSSLTERLTLNIGKKKENLSYHLEPVNIGMRTLSNLADMILLLAALSPTLYHFFTQGSWVMLPQTIFLLALLLLFQGFLLIHDHQTIGKKIAGLAIVDSRTGDIPSITQLVLFRHCLPWGLYFVPVLRYFVLGINLFLLFAARGRGIHDVLSNTKVAPA